MNLDQLIELYIIQKEHHEKPENLKVQAKFHKIFNDILIKHEYKVEEYFAPSDLINFSRDITTDIPFVLFKPNVTNANNKRPLIIHTHGGPNVYFYKDTKHAEIAYFISKGYVVACPNYRGSSDHPNKENEVQVIWKSFQDNIDSVLHNTGPVDVYTVAKYLASQSYIDSSNIFLRGGSCGSFINARLLEKINQGKFANIFKAVHLSGGFDYPCAMDIPLDTALLITHGADDHVSSPENAEYFMEQLLINQLAFKYNNPSLHLNRQTFYSHTGNHHLISDDITSESEINSKGYADLIKYLRLSTSFIEQNTGNNKFKYEDTYSQLLNINSRPINSHNLYLEIKSLAELIKQSTLFIRNALYPKQSTPTLSPSDKSKFYGPTMAMLKLYLDKAFTNEVCVDMKEYLLKYFKPFDFFESKVVEKAGECIAYEQKFFKQLIEIINKEEEFLSTNPNHMVLYHAANDQVLHLYSFIHVWKKMLKNDSDDLLNIHDLRMNDFIKNSFKSIDSFLSKMQENKNNETEYFNYLPGFSDRAISCNPSLISNSHSTSSSSLWWYFDNVSSGINIEHEITCVIRKFLNILGITSESAVDKYFSFFIYSYRTLGDVVFNNSLLQQIFIPYEVAKKRAYLCQIWGEQFKANDMNLHNPEVVQDLINDPVKFEENFRHPENISSVNNFENCPGFGDDINFKYTGLLQIRYLYQNTDMVSFSYYKNINDQTDFLVNLINLVIEDFAKFLACDSPMPKIISYCSVRVNSLSHKSPYNIEAIFLQQKELFLGLTDNFIINDYKEILLLSFDEKSNIQKRLFEQVEVLNSSNIIFSFSLCFHLEGFTYYDLLMDGLNISLQSSNEELVNNTKKIIRIIEIITMTDNPTNNIIKKEEYNFLNSNLREVLINFELSTEKHNFYRNKNTSGNPLNEKHLWETEKLFAIEGILEIAKEAIHNEQSSKLVL